MHGGLIERPIHQSLLRLTNPPPLSDLLKTMFAGLRKDWKFCAAEVDRWTSAPLGEHGRLYANNGTANTASISGSFTVDEADNQVFELQLIKALERGVYWTVSYTAKRTATLFELHVRSLFESTAPVTGHIFTPEEMLTPMRTLIDTYSFEDGAFRVASSVHSGTEEIDVEILVDTLLSADRTMPVVVITEPWHVDPRIVAKRLSSIAHVVAMLQSMTYPLSDKITREKSVFQGYARIYTAPFDLPNANPRFNRHFTFSPAMLTREHGIDELVARAQLETLNIPMSPPMGLSTPRRNEPVKATPSLKPATNGTVKTLETATTSSATPATAPAHEAVSAAEPSGAEDESESHTHVGTAPEPTVGHIGSWIRAARVRARMTQADLAEAVGLTPSGISFIEKDANPRSPRLSAILARLGLSREQIGGATPAAAPVPQPSPAPVPRERKSTTTKASVKAPAAAAKIPQIEEPVIEPAAPDTTAPAATSDFERRLTDLESRLTSRIATLEHTVRSMSDQVGNIELQALEIAEKLSSLNVLGAVTGNPQLGEVETALGLLVESVQKLQKTTHTPASVVPSDVGESPSTPAEVARPKSEPAWEGAYPPSLDPQYATKFIAQFGDSIAVHPRAIKGLKESLYENPERVYRALEVLAKDYVPMRRGHVEENSQRFQDVLKKFAALGLRLEKRQRKRTYTGEYVVEWNGTKQRVTQALKSNASPVDPKRCLRIYFFWDDERQQVVLCWLPGHLNVMHKV